MPTLYNPRTMVFTIPTIDTKTVSTKNLWLEKDGTRMDSKITTDEFEINFLPTAPYVELCKYRIIFDTDIKHKDGKFLCKQYVLPYIIKNRSLIFQVRTHGSIRHLREEPAPIRTHYPYIAKPIITPTSTYIEDVFEDDFVLDDSTKESKKKRLIPVIAFSLLALMVLLSVIITNIRNNSVDISGSSIANDAISSGHSTQIKSGTILSTTDPIVEARDIRIYYTGNAKTTTLHIWDYAYEDGDTVQVFVDGKAVTKQIVIYNKPFKVKVPTTGIVEVRGIHDGGGGITYAVYCKLNKTTYLNDAPIGGSNKYIFVRK